MPSAPRDALGLCLGASSISLAVVRPGHGTASIIRARSRAHGGDPASTLRAMLEDVPGWRAMPVAVTGRKLRSMVRLPSLSEPEAVELAARHVLGPEGDPVSVLCAGGETFMAYGLDARRQVRDIQSGNKCASGTGEFLLQQLGRMGLGVEDLAGLDPDAKPYAVSGRCSVFCKSDCTHALNKGAPRDRVAAGLGRMMAEKCAELLQNLPLGRVLLTGGCAANAYLTRFLRPHVGELVIPAEAPWFEALGAALWALEHRPEPPGGGDILLPRSGSFLTLAPLRAALHRVEFKDHPRGQARPGDEVLVGLDVGSTTTRGVVLRRSDAAVLAGEYLRTQGDPIGASRQVYASLAAQLGAPVRVRGIGVTGSGRAIAALHAQATAAINEIVAHATAAAHYDPQVDTIFEIGGQDAKYTLLSAGQPCDSAMNEACSAGTGSFLEESARESLGVDTRDIADLALQAAFTPNFNDQCAAFIGSDIKVAAQEGLGLPEILAGLVHSVCLNYVSRVKGSRPVGRRVFMQGGVCYNRAVPAAMAMLTGRTVVVPPDPGLMGALGVALEVDRRMRQGLLAEADFDLEELAARQAGQREPFVCRGGKGGQRGCDRGCTIARIEVGGKVHPFGGICNRFDNLRRGADPDTASLDVVQARQRRVFRDLEAPGGSRPTVGVSRSYLTNRYFPLFNAFFRELGFDPVLPARADPEGIKRRGSALCFPGELAHGFLADLLTREPDALFLPHVKAVPAAPGQRVSCTCVLLQGEPFALKAAFPELAAFGPRLLVPTLDFTHGVRAAAKAFIQVGRQLGASSRQGERAFQAGLEAQRACRADLSRLGRDALARLADMPDTPGVVIFGRTYNAFAPQANKAVPEKLATRGAMAIPCDILPLDQARAARSMYWGQGRTIMAAARTVSAAPGLYGTYITNFSCGPDSFLLGYFREEMGDKPSLTLELDSHTADAGLETRLEAFLDIAAIHARTRPGSRPVSSSGSGHGPGTSPALPGTTGADAARSASGDAGAFRPAQVEQGPSGPGVRASDGNWLPLTHSRVRLLLPSMNPYGSALAAASLAAHGIRGVALPPADEAALQLGRAHSTCKECLPLQLTVGTLLKHLEERPDGQVSAYFMPGAQGPCRFGQYSEFTARLIERLRIPDTAVFTPVADAGYSGLPGAVTLGIWRAVVLGDAFEEMRSLLLAAARDPGDAVALLDAAYAEMLSVMGGPWKQALARLEHLARELGAIPLRAARRDVPTLALVGEIYVRHDPLSRQNLVERLAARGFAVRTSPVTEWIFYTDWLQNAGLTENPGLAGRLRQFVKGRAYRRIRRALAPTGLISPAQPGAAQLVRAGQAFLSPRLTGETILTVGAALHEILDHACGVISLGPFGCMPSRLAEAVLSGAFTTATLESLEPGRTRGLHRDHGGRLPFLSLETDGNPFPQLIEARLEAFCLQAARLHEILSRR